MKLPYSCGSDRMGVVSMRGCACCGAGGDSRETDVSVGSGSVPVLLHAPVRVVSTVIARTRLKSLLQWVMIIRSLLRPEAREATGSGSTADCSRIACPLHSRPRDAHNALRERRLPMRQGSAISGKMAHFL